MSEKIRDIRINKPTDIRRLMQQQINEIRKSKLGTENKAKLISTLSNTALKAMHQTQYMEELEKLKDYIEELKEEGDLK